MGSDTRRRILIRSGKDPFTPVSGEATLAQDVFNSNTGNYLFAHSVHKMLMTPGTEVVSNATLSETRPATATAIARVNEQFDAFVIPLANAFRPGFEPRLRCLTSLVAGLTVPVVVTGVGAQAALGVPAMSGSPLDDVVREFVAAVLERSASIGVRGEFTAAYLRDLGFPADTIDVIGCPSVFLHGPDFRLAPAAGDLAADARVALSVTDGVPHLGRFVARLADEHPASVFIGQDRDDLRAILWGEGPARETDPELPLRPDHRLYREDRVRFPLETWTWLQLLAEFDFAVGTRLHGSVAALLAGTPATLLAHDSRTAELATHHQLPHVSATALEQDPSARELWASYDPEPFNEVYQARFETFLTFLERNGLEHVHQPGLENPEYDERVSTATFAPPLAPLSPSHPEEYAARLRWLRDATTFDSRKHRQAYRAPYPFPPPRDQWTPEKESARELERRVTAAENGLVRARQRLRAAERRAERLAKRVAGQRQQLRSQRQRLDRQKARLDRQQERLDRQRTRLDLIERKLDSGFLTRVRRRLSSSD